MSAPRTRTHFTEDEYLVIERASDERHEYVDGRIYAMAGESDDHNSICVNLARELSLQLKGTSCRTHTQNMKVRSGPEPKPFHSPKGFSHTRTPWLFAERRGFTTNTAMSCSTRL
jgi:Uma2 family endonuclease